jgi:DNA-binding HxlR family transcriptional regulator
VKRTDTSDWPCNIARSASILGDHWNLLLLRDACLGTRRFEDFQRSLGIGRNMLSLRLRGLVAGGLLERSEYRQGPVRHVLAAMDAWGRRWLAGDEGSPVTLHHDLCDRDMHAVVVCSECAAPIDVRHVRASAAPAS